ncbi:MAG: riboflavin kinase/FMN adenylyltransferase [Crocinitomix sp.]|jgi:riboflavin kinase/FMN adenylyltransferase
MNVYYSIDEVPKIKNAVLTLGTFDGVHLGHQEIINFLNKSAQELDGETVLFTLFPHPRIVLNPTDHGMTLIQSINERIKKLERFGIDHLILYPFSVEFSRLSATEFVRDILVNKINVKLMTIGYNHHFGRNRQGNLELLKELGTTYDFRVQEIPAYSKSNIKISSTKIRLAVQDGDILKANTFLGEPFQFQGKVMHGDRIGTKIGFPTANIAPFDENQVIPKNGVYAVRASVNNKSYSGMMNIGTRPTVSKSEERRIEVNIFDFDEMIYGEELSVTVYKRIRSEQSFESLEALQEQLQNDKEVCHNILH